MKKRSQINEKYKWDLSYLCESDEKFYKTLETLKEYLPKFKAFEGKLNNKKDILKYLQLEEEFDMIANPIALYCHLKGDEILSDEKRNIMQEKLEHLFNEFSVETSFASSELHELDDKLLDEIISDKAFSDYQRTFEQIKKAKKHVLSKAEEKLLSGMNFLDGFSSNMRMLSDVDLKFGKIKDSKGKDHELTQSNYSIFMASKDRTLRKNAICTLNGTFGKMINTFASNYISEVKADCYFAKVRKYSSALMQALEDEEITKEVYDTLIKKVHESLKILFKFFKLKAKIMNLKDFAIYDHMADIGKSKSKYSYDEAMEIIKEALSPLGEEYQSLLERAKNERWIDVYPNLDKRSGAYQSSVYRYPPYVLTNFEGDLNSIFTLAHELGHAMHSYYSDKTQVYAKSGYPIFLAEIASTTNEMLLFNYFLSKTKNKQEKIYLYNKLFTEVKGTIFRQTMFAEFEADVHAMQEEGEALTKDSLCRKYYALNKKYFGSVKLIDEIKYEWARIPHFFTSFYVYKYATGLISAITFTNKILSDKESAVKDYFKFLTAGGSNPPLETLKKAGCDLENEKTFDMCFEYLNDMLKNWEALVKEKK